MSLTRLFARAFELATVMYSLLGSAYVLSILEGFDGHDQAPTDQTGVSGGPEAKTCNAERKPWEMEGGCAKLSVFIL